MYFPRIFGLIAGDNLFREGGPYQVVRILRILRVLRVLKLAEVSHSMSLFGRGLHRSRDYIITLTLTLVIITILFASLIFHFETGATPAATGVPDSIYGTDGKGPRAPAGSTVDPPAIDLDLDPEELEDSSSDEFLSVPDVFWFCVSEITTVGNASKSPGTPVGQALAVSRRLEFTSSIQPQSHSNLAHPASIDVLAFVSDGLLRCGLIDRAGLLRRLLPELRAGRDRQLIPGGLARAPPYGRRRQAAQADL